MTTLRWPALQEELDRWTDAGQAAALWWRDDDAVTATPALERLATVARQAEAPITLAVIPATADDALAGYVAGEPLLDAAVHGWSHRNHEPAGRKTAEFGAARSPDAIDRDLAAGRESIVERFGDRGAWLFVPPWNRISPAAASRLAAHGYSALSVYGAPGLAQRPDGLRTLNVEIDPIDWRGSRSLADEAELIARVVGLLRERRLSGRFAEPLGLMTHHLLHDERIWSFVERFLEDTCRHAGCRWQRAHALTGR